LPIEALTSLLDFFLLWSGLGDFLRQFPMSNPKGALMDPNCRGAEIGSLCPSLQFWGVKPSAVDLSLALSLSFFFPVWTFAQWFSYVPRPLLFFFLPPQRIYFLFLLSAGLEHFRLSSPSASSQSSAVIFVQGFCLLFLVDVQSVLLAWIPTSRFYVFTF